MTSAHQLADDLFATLLDSDPVNATLLGIGGRDHLLESLSLPAEQSVRTKLAALAERARADTTGASAQDRLTRAVVAHEAQTAIDRIDSRAVEYTVTNWFAAPAARLLTMAPMATLSDASQAQAYLGRLAAIPEFLSQAADRNRMGVAAGRLPVRHLVHAAIAQIEGYLADRANDPFATPAPPSTGPASRAFRAFLADRDRLLERVVRPAFAGYRDVLADEIAPHGRPAERAGLCWLPEGTNWYATLQRGHTSNDQTPEELHQLGLDLMAGLTKEYAEIARTVLGTPDVQQGLARLRDDPALHWDTGDELLNAAKAAIARAEHSSSRWFTRLPGQPCSVRPAPGAGGPAAYYVPPSLDGARPGTYYLDTSRPRERDRSALEAVAFHEGVPGHHLQFSLAQELTHLPLLRRTSELTAYVEGWAGYVERLADEMGLYSDELARLGMVSADLRRTARLVVDTGIHRYGWARDKAVAYLRDNTARPLVEIESDVDRFIALPGQALAYTVGRLEIQRMRAEAERGLGGRFDIQAFHDVVLRGGALPLAVLADAVADWVDRLNGDGPPSA